MKTDLIRFATFFGGFILTSLILDSTIKYIPNKELYILAVAFIMGYGISWIASRMEAQKNE